jgi:hypothetical protein
MRTHHHLVRHVPRRREPRWAHPKLSVRYNLEWDPLHADVEPADGGWASFVRGLGRAKAWIVDQFSVGIAVLMVIAVLLIVGVLIGDALMHALRFWLGR